jgi:acetyl esterase/lipase
MPSTFEKILGRARARIAFARLAGNYFRALAIVRVRRRVFGPRRAAWSERYEALVEMLRRDTASLRPLSAAKIRAKMRAPMQPPILERVHVEPARGAPAASTWITPKGESPKGILLYFHGGGYIVGSVQSHLAFLARVAIKARVRVLAVDYRLAPENPFPAALDDALAVHRWLAKEHGASNVVVGGDSAGGGLTVATLAALRDARDPLPAGAVLISPWVDLSVGATSIRGNARFDWIDEAFLRRCAREYTQSVDRADPRVSPVNASFRGFPPLLVQVGDAELLHDEARTLCDRAKAAGVDVAHEVTPDMVHVWPLFADLVPEGRVAIDRIARFLEDRLQARAPVSTIDA